MLSSCLSCFGIVLTLLVVASSATPHTDAVTAHATSLTAYPTANIDGDVSDFVAGSCEPASNTGGPTPPIPCNHAITTSPVQPAPQNDRFITTWKTSHMGESITIPVGNTAGTYAVDWGDGKVTTHDGDATHVYDSPGTYRVQMYGDFARIHLGGSEPENAAKLQSINQWGSVRWSTMEGAFEDASNMVYRATDTPDLSRVTDMSSMFSGASSFNGDISDWDVSSVKDMSSTFLRATSFNQPLDSWDVSSVEDMSGMLSVAMVFNQPLNSWDVSSVKDMKRMFIFATAFNQNLGNWYIVPEDTVVDPGDTEVTAISAQNSFLDSQDPTYVIEPGGDGDLFTIEEDTILFVQGRYAKSTYDITVISTGGFDSPNSRDITVTVTDGGG